MWLSQQCRKLPKQLLTVLNFVDDSPLLVFGRAALLGYMTRGNSRTCLTAYPTCPRDPDALVDYLNNHNGGFFRYFSGQPGQGRPPYDQDAFPQGSQNQYLYRPYPQYTQGHPQQPYPPYSDNRYPQYPVDNYNHLSHLPYPSRPFHYKRPSSLHGHKNQPYRRYAGKYTTAKDYYQERILVRPHQTYLNVNEFFRKEPKREQSKLVFPTRDGKELHFPEVANTNSGSPTPVPFFPDRTGTGKLLLDSQGVHYAQPENLVNFRDQRSIKFPAEMSFPEN